MQINKIIAIQNYGPSGTLLMQSLLDSHLQILSLPALHGQRLLLFYQDHHMLDLDSFILQFMDANVGWFEPERIHKDFGLINQGVNKDQRITVNKFKFLEHFAKELKSKPQITRKEFLVAVYVAYAQSLGRDISQCEYILYPIHCMPKKFAEQLTEDFEFVRFLHLVREPVQCLGSLAKHIARHPAWIDLNVLECVTAQILNDYSVHAGPYTAYGIQPYVADKGEHVQSRVVRLEDVHKHPREIMEKICKWVELDWNDVLLESTFDGILWHNRPESVQQTGIGSQTITQMHTDILSKFDKLRLSYLARHIHARYKYDQVPKWWIGCLMPLLILLPFKMEKAIKRRAHNWREYLRVRLQWIYPSYLQALFYKNNNYIKILGEGEPEQAKV